MQNAFATLTLVAFPVLAVYLFALKPFNRALLWTVLLAQLLLPAGAFIKFEMIPQFDKNSLPSLCLLAACIIGGRFRLREWRGFGLAGLFAALFLLGPIMTSQLNGDPISYGPVRLPGVGLYDGVSSLISSFITLSPYFIAREFLREEVDNGEILRVTILGMLVYTLPLLLEVRLSPQLHYWVYGFHTSMFAQSVRGDGFRPMVFMGHGLVAAHFMLIATIAALGLWRVRLSVVRVFPRIKNNFRAVTIYLAFVLALCRTLGANLYGMFLAPIILVASARTQMRFAVAFVVLALLYPTMRHLDLVPTKALVAIANTVSLERGESLAFRFFNEDLLLKHATERPVFGWGRFGRNRVYDPDSGQDLVLTDGEWIIVLGQFGAVGFIAEFGLLCLSVFRSAAALRYARSDRERIFLSVLALIVAVSIFDLLPNAFLVPWTWLTAGALLGRSEQLLARRVVSIAAETAMKADPELASAAFVPQTLRQ